MSLPLLFCDARQIRRRHFGPLPPIEFREKIFYFFAEIFSFSTCKMTYLQYIL